MMATRTTSTRATSNHDKDDDIDALFEFLDVQNRTLSINNKRYKSPKTSILRGCTQQFYDPRTINPDDPVKHLQLNWNHREVQNPVGDDKFNLESVWDLQNIKELELVFFPHSSFTMTTTETQQTEIEKYPRNNNNIGAPTWASIGRLSKTLQKLKMTDFHHIHFRLSPDIGMLVHLAVLEIDSFTRLESLPVEIGCLESLKIFKLCQLNRLKWIPSEIGKLKNLKELSIKWCASLVRLPKEIGDLQNLTKLEISNCRSFKHLPAELNDCFIIFGGNLQILEIYNNSPVQTTDFLFRMDHFTKLRQMKVDWDIYLHGMLQNLPTSLERLTFTQFKGEYLSIPTQKQPPPTTTTTTTTYVTTRTKSPSLLCLLPCNIQTLEIRENNSGINSNKVPMNEFNRDVIYSLLDAFPSLYIHISSYIMSNARLQNERSLGLFTPKSLHLLFLNKCGRILLKESFSVEHSTNNSDNERKRALSLSMWPIVLDDVKKRVGRISDMECKQIMEASVIFSLLQGPVLMDRPMTAAAASITTTTTTTISTRAITTTATTIPLETTKNLKRPFPFADDDDDK